MKFIKSLESRKYTKVIELLQSRPSVLGGARLFVGKKEERKNMKKIYDFICKVEVIVAQVTLVSMIILIFASVIARLLRNPINWGVDMATFLFAWSCFLSANFAWREEKLMSVDIFVKNFPEKIQKYIKLFNYFVISLFLIYLIIFGFRLSYTTRLRAFQGIPGFSYAWATLSIPVGAILLLITTSLKMRNTIQKNSPQLSLRRDI